MSEDSMHKISAAPPETGMTASPNSSDEVESQTVTPSTRLSNLTPDDIRELPSSGSRGIIRAKVPPPFDLNVTTANTRSLTQAERSASLLYNDPFVSASSLGSATTRSSADPSKLSPAAASFTPASVLDSPVTPDRITEPNLADLSKVGQNPDFLPAPASSRNVESSRSLEIPVSASPQQSTSPSDTLRYSTALPKLRDENTAKLLGSFTSDSGTSRCLLVQTGPSVSPQWINDQYSLDSYPSLIGLITSEVATQGAIFLRFADMRDADRALRAVRSYPAQWAARHISPMDFALKNHAKSSRQGPTSLYEGQLMICLTYVGQSQTFETDNVVLALRKALGRHGDILAIGLMQSNIFDLVIRVEFFDTNAATMALSRKDSLRVSMFSLTIEAYEPDVSPKEKTPVKTMGPIIIGPDDSGLDKTLADLSIRGRHDRTQAASIRQSPYQSSPVAKSFTDRKEAVGQHTPSPLSAFNQGSGTAGSLYGASWSPSFHNSGVQSPMWSPYSPGTIGQERGTPTTLNHHHLDMFHPQSRTLSRASSRQHLDFANANHNVVDVDRIRAGLDVRTTIMLRNIPNKIDQAMLKDIVDETSLGKYDFMYLRIDFANNCNVGYAFINFEDPIWIVDFVTARAGHRWNRYNSDKVAEVSYATIQGRDCLIQKFRNSSVMLEHPSFRPKLYRTGTGPLVGTEENFPGPDNPSKMRRSVENAEHVGLFAPRAGQNFRDEQRRRRSQFDRGTRMAEVEDIYEPNSLSIRGYSPTFRPGGQFPTFETAYQGFNGPYY